MIRCMNVRKLYGEVEALRGLDLEVKTGEILGIVGRSGAGKSTLIRLFTGIETPTSGTVQVMNKEPAKMSPKALRAFRQEMSMIFQGLHLMSGRSVFENVAFPLRRRKVERNEIESRVMGLLERVGLSDKREAYPAMLSGGQKQRVAIARALVTRPRLLLLDEPTSALDKETASEILDLLSDLRAEYGLTILMITHDEQVAKTFCMRQLRLHEGREVPALSIERGTRHAVR